MNARQPEQTARRVALAFGMVDAGAGLLLMLAPHDWLTLLEGGSVGAPWAHLRWVGAFVFALGTAYLWAAFAGGAWRLRALFETTLPFRLAAGAYAAVAVASGWIGVIWTAVPVADAAIVLVQISLLRKGVGA